jgi:hypothetical protein
MTHSTRAHHREICGKQPALTAVSFLLTSELSYVKT